MARGEQEKRCFDCAKKLLEESYYKFVVPKNELDSIRRIFQTAIPNPKPSRFPDFIFEDGFIEHFQVTSAKETKKGAKVAEAITHFKKDSELLDEEMLEILTQPHTQNELYTRHMEMECPECSYDYYEKSFKKNFERHVKSLENYTGAKDIGAFLIEQSGAPITILKDNKFVDFYHLHMDEKMLDYLYDYKDKIKYVIFYHQTFCDIISLDNIPRLKSQIPKNIVFGLGRLRQIHMANAISID